jgi:ATP-dependent Clp protease ATP-binding subunit ClpX
MIFLRNFKSSLIFNLILISTIIPLASAEYDEAIDKKEDTAVKGGGALVIFSGKKEDSDKPDENIFKEFFRYLDNLENITRLKVLRKCERFHQDVKPKKEEWEEQLTNYHRELETIDDETRIGRDAWHPYVNQYLETMYNDTESNLKKDESPTLNFLAQIKAANVERAKTERKVGAKRKRDVRIEDSEDDSGTSKRRYLESDTHTTSEGMGSIVMERIIPPIDPVFPIKQRYWEQAIKAHTHLPSLFPIDIVRLFGRSIIGQEDALRVVARGLHGHFVRVAENERVRLSRVEAESAREIHRSLVEVLTSDSNTSSSSSAMPAPSVSGHTPSPEESDPAFLSKSNLVIVGPTGSGKTATLSLIEEMFDVPVILVDGSRVTPEGWRGDDVSNWFKMLLLKAGGDIEKAQRGIICIDEFDKILGSRSDHDPRGLKGIAVQSELLKAVEGAEISIKPGGMFSPEVKFDTRNIWWIAMGVFDGIERSPDGKVNHDGLARFGLTRELCGRFTNVCTFNPVDERALVRILQESRLSPLENAKRFLSLTPYNIELEIDEAGLNSIARNAFIHGNGSRSLQSIIDFLISPIIDDAHLYTGGTLKLTEKEIEDRLRSLPKVSERKRDEPPPGMYV